MSKTTTLRAGLAGAAALGLFLGAPATGVAQAAATGPSGTAKALPSGLRQDLEKLHASNQAEIQTGRMAEEKAESAQVKQLGTTMDQQHTQLDKDLQDFAERRGISLDGVAYQTELKRLQANAQSKLSGKQGQAFDRAYSDLMVQEHTQDVNKTLPKSISDAKKAGDTELTSMLTSTRVTLEQHLVMARQAQAAERKQAASSAGKGVGGAGAGGSGQQPKP